MPSKRPYCPKCKAQFTPKNKLQKYCTPRCQQLFNKASYARRQRALHPKTKGRTPEVDRAAAWRCAAARIGESYEEYAAHRNAGELRCSGCKTWHPASEFSTRSYCRKAKREKERRREAHLRETERAEKAKRARMAKYAYRNGELTAPHSTEPRRLPAWVNQHGF